MLYGIERLLKDLRDLGYEDPISVSDGQGIRYAIIKDFEIPEGTFKGKLIELGIPAPNEYPRILGASMHVKSLPHLVSFGCIANQRNVIASPLGSEWQYWSYQFIKRPEFGNQTLELISQINGIFKNN